MDVKGILTLQVNMLLTAVVSMIVLAIPVFYLWNWVGPDVFGGPELGYWQVLSIGLLSRYVTNGLSSGSVTTNITMKSPD